MTSCMPSQNDQMATIFIKKYKPLLLSECLKNIHQYFVIFVRSMKLWMLSMMSWMKWWVWEGTISWKSINVRNAALLTNKRNPDKVLSMQRKVWVVLYVTTQFLKSLLYVQRNDQEVIYRIRTVAEREARMREVVFTKIHNIKYSKAGKKCQ